VQRCLCDQGISLYFNPTAAPFCGGVLGARIRSFRSYLLWFVQAASLNIDELYSVLTKIAACLNARPFTVLFSVPKQLTPCHLFISRPLDTIRETTLLEVEPNLLKRWQLVHRVVQRFWKRWRWSSEYLSRLQLRPKWCST
jgi:hypothetical protein